MYLEDLYLAEQRWLDMQEGRSTTSPLAEVEKELGLAE